MKATPLQYKPKKKKCRNCKGSFLPERTMQVACSLLCANIIGKALNAKKQAANAAHRKREFYANDPKLAAKRAKTMCHKFIKLRDKDKPCVSCGTVNDVQYCAGHYKPSGVNALYRYDERNIHKQCNRYCNLGLSGNLSNYRPELINRIGIDAVLEIENNKTEKKWSLQELNAITEYYREKIKQLEAVNSGNYL